MKKRATHFESSGSLRSVAGVFMLTAALIFAGLPAAAEEGPAPQAAAPQATETKTDASSEDESRPKNDMVLSPLPGIGMMAGGGTLLLAGIITGSVALGINSNLKDKCPDNYCLPPQHDDVDTVETLAAVTDAFIPLSIALMIAGAATYVAARRTATKYGDKSDDESEPSEPRVSFTGSSLSWRF